MLKKGDFIELDYTGRIKDDKIVFDTTVEQIAKDCDIFSKNYKYTPVIICIGEGHVVNGLDNALIGKNPGKYTIEVKAEHAFGKKSANLLKLIPMRLFSKDDVKPFVGLEVNVDGTLGIVRSVSGGRVIVDFNHPLSGRDLIYDVDIKGVVDDDLEKTKALLELIKVPYEDIDVTDGKAVIVTKTKLPDELTNGLGDSIKKTAHLKSVAFKTEEESKKAIKEDIQKEKQQKSAKPDFAGSTKAELLSAKNKFLSTTNQDLLKSEISEGSSGTEEEKKQEAKEGVKKEEKK